MLRPNCMLGVRLHAHNSDVVILVPETKGPYLIPVGRFFIQQEAMGVSRSMLVFGHTFF